VERYVVSHSLDDLELGNNIIFRKCKVDIKEIFCMTQLYVGMTETKES